MGKYARDVDNSYLYLYSTSTHLLVNTRWTEVPNRRLASGENSAAKIIIHTAQLVSNKKMFYNKSIN